jgi:hypothetical protein
LVLHVTVGSKFWRGRGAVLAWRAERGGYVKSVAKSTAVMFSVLIFSYMLEFAVVFFLPPTDLARECIPLITYSPVGFVFWRTVRG